MSKITVYGASWCHDSRRTLAQLDRLDVEYKYVDVDADAAANAWIAQQNNGKRVTPTVDVNGKLYFEPSDTDMEAALRASGAL